MAREVTWIPKSLFKTCLELITSRLAYCNPNVTVTSSSNPVEEEKSVSKSVVNPFDELPTHLLEQIIDHILTSKGHWLTIYHQDLLVAAHTRKLDLCDISDHNESALFLELAAIRCQQLTSLRIPKCSAECFSKFLPAFKDLRELDVTFTAFNNCCLHTVGVYCRNLLKLNLEECHNVTDEGIEALCGGESELGKEMPLGKSGQCKSIQELSIYGTQVTKKGVEMALLHLPHLKQFDSWHSVEVLAAMHSHQTNSILPKFSLTDLCLNNSWHTLPSASPSFGRPYKNGDLLLAATLCPFVTSVFISCDVENVNDHDILGLMGLKYLEKLRIVSFRPESKITFDGGLVPLLKVAGRSLTFLDLYSHFDQFVRLDCLVEYCPNLEYLSLFNSSTGLEEGEVPGEVMGGRANNIKMKPKFTWNKLKKLSIVGDGCEIPAESVLLALSSPALKKLEISSCSALDDDLVRLVFGYHSFASLKWLWLSNCRAITINGVRLFGNKGLDWGCLKIKNCDSVIFEEGDLEERRMSTFEFDSIDKSWSKVVLKEQRFIGTTVSH